MASGAAQRANVEPMIAVGFGEFSAAVDRWFVPLKLTPGNRACFRGVVRSVTTDGVHATEIAASTHVVERTAELIACDSSKPFYKVSVMVSGSALLIQDKREAVLTAGDLAIYDTSRPYSLEFAGDFRTLVVMFPQEMIGLPAETVGEVTAVPVSGSSGIGAVVSPFLAGLGDHLEQFGGGTGVRLAHSTVDLIRAVVASQVDSGDMGASSRSVLRSRVRRYIDDNLGSPALTPASIAAANFISTRHLHGIFQEEGVTVAAWIRSRRLEACRRDLVDPLMAQQSILAIAVRWGFVDAAHFSRLFKTTYGMSPNEFRLTSRLRLA